MARRFSRRDDQVAAIEDSYINEAVLPVETGMRAGGATTRARVGQDTDWTWSIRGPPRPQ
jgi:hypothetical protein